MSSRLKRIYKRYNRKYFDGLLPDSDISYGNMYHYWGFCCPWEFSIEISNGLTRYQEKGTILHEMIHMFQYHVEEKDELDTTAEWHDIEFMALAEAISQLSGYEVA